MHVHDLNPKKTLVVVIIFVLIIIAGFLTLKQPRFKYKLSLQQSLNMLHNEEACFHPWQLADVLSKVNGNVVLVDLRDNFTYSKGHIPGAENISAYDLTEDKYFNHLKDLYNKGVTVVLYGKDRLQANGPWMWFRQLGFDNIKILLGGYNFYKAHKADLSKSKEDKSYILGIPDYNYSEMAQPRNASMGEAKKNKKKTPVIRRKKKTTTASGGC